MHRVCCCDDDCDTAGLCCAPSGCDSSISDSCACGSVGGEWVSGTDCSADCLGQCWDTDASTTPPSMTTKAVCDALGWLWFQDGECPDSCLGRCCLGNNNCMNGTTKTICTGLGGNFDRQYDCSVGCPGDSVGGEAGWVYWILGLRAGYVNEATCERCQLTSVQNVCGGTIGEYAPSALHYEEWQIYYRHSGITPAAAMAAYAATAAIYTYHNENTDFDPLCVNETSITHGEYSLIEMMRQPTGVGTFNWNGCYVEQSGGWDDLYIPNRTCVQGCAREYSAWGNIGATC